MNEKLWYVLTFSAWVEASSSKRVAPNSTRNLDIFQLIHKYWIIRPMSVRSGSAVGECDSIQFASSFIIYVVDGLANTRHKNKTVFMMNGIIGIEVGNLWHPFTYLLSARRNNCCSKKLTIFSYPSLHLIATRTPPQIKLFTRRHFLDHINKYPPCLFARELFLCYRWP